MGAESSVKDGYMVTLPHNNNCLCNQNSHEVLFHVDKYAVCRCACGQAYVTGIDRNSIAAEYDGDNYFIERNNYLEKWGELSIHFQKIVTRIKKYKSNGAFLDVGCSVGIFLDVARQKAIEVKGVQFSKWA
jgi:hypothetical protein